MTVEQLREKMNEKMNERMKLSIYLCTGEKDQVQIIEENEKEAERKFRIYHQLPDDEQVEVINLTELCEVNFNK